MTQQEHQLARLTGEPLTTIPRGDSWISQQSDDPGPQAVQLVVDCPLCGQPVPYPGQASGGSDTMAECARCDIYFSFDPDDIHTLPQGLESSLRPSRGPGF
jgi:hypothetical protein